MNSVLINQYKKDHHIPPHKDNEDCLGINPVIFSISAGDKRVMLVKSEHDESQIHIELAPGSLLIMGGKFNTDFLHSVPKTSSKKVRINLTFRLIKNAPKPSQVTLGSSATSNDFQQMVLHKLTEMHEVINELKADLQIKNNEINSLKQQITKLEKVNQFKSEDSGENKLVILKSSIQTASLESCAVEINKSMPNVNLKTDDILSVDDFRPKKIYNIILYAGNIFL